jgi:hypothetical protein
VDITTPNEASSNCGGRLIYATRFGLGREINALLVHGGTQSTPVYSLFIHNMNIQIQNGGKYMVPLIAHPPFFSTSILTLSTFFLLDFGNCYDSVVFFVFCF